MLLQSLIINDEKISVFITMVKTFCIPLTTAFPLSSTPSIPHIIDFNEEPAVLICAL